MITVYAIPPALVEVSQSGEVRYGQEYVIDPISLVGASTAGYGEFNIAEEYIGSEASDDDSGSDAEWAEIARSAPSSDRIRAIAKYLRETGQAAT